MTLRETIHDAGTYSFVRRTGSGASGDLSSAGAGKVLALTPFPAGLAVGNRVYISGGSGTAEAVAITAVSGAANAPTGTVTVTTANAHSGAWTVQSASSGIQEAIVAATGPVSIPNGRSYIYGTVILRPGVQLMGAGKAESPTSGGTYLDASAVTSGYVFDYLSPVQGAPYDLKSGFALKDFTLVTGLNGIRINDDNAALTWQAYLTDNVELSNLSILGNSSYLTDPNANTTTVPTLAALKAYGVGISLNMTFRARVSDVNAFYFGVPVYIFGDENLVEGGGFSWSSMAIYVYGGSGAAFGNKNIIRHIKMGALTRVGAIVTDSCGGTYIENNYFEIDIPQYVRVVNSVAVTIGPNNWFQSGNTTTAPSFYIDVQTEALIHGNTMIQGVHAVQPIQVQTTQYQTKYPNIVRMWSNGSYFPQPGNRRYLGGATPVFFPPVPGVLVDSVNPLLWNAYNNPGEWTFGSNAFPFVTDATTGRAAFNNADATANIAGWQAYFHPKGRLDRTYVLKMSARKTGTGDVFASVSYVGNSTTSVYTGTLTFTTTAETSVQSSTNFLIPAGETLNGYFAVTFIPEQALVEQVELVPVS